MSRFHFFPLLISILVTGCNLVHARKEKPRGKPGRPHLFNPGNGGNRGRCTDLVDSTTCDADDKCQWCNTNTTDGKCVRKKGTCCRAATEEATCEGNGETCVWWTSSFDGVTTVGECKDVKCKHITNQTICEDTIPYCGWLTSGECVWVRPGM